MVNSNGFIVSQHIRKGYRLGQEDETLLPHVLADLGGVPRGRIAPRDGVIFFNLRGEREVELTRSLTEKGFHEFPVVPDMDLSFATMIEYSRDLSVGVAFPPEGEITYTLSEVLSRHGKRQLKITEGEKSFHVSYFFNGKRQEPFPGEDRVFVPTRKDVTLFDEAPEMSIDKLSAAIGETLNKGEYDFILANLPNVDVVSHVDRDAPVLQAIEAVDRAMGEIVAAAQQAGYSVIVTADHGSAEKRYYQEGTVDTGHSASPVPFLLIHPGPLAVRPSGDLTDVAPTVLQLMGLPQPAAMTGKSLLESTDIKLSSRVLLLLLDGWGHREEREGNLIAIAQTPAMDELWRTRPRAVLQAAGLSVGLPAGTVGNSEAGHMHLGSGRTVYSDRARIDRAIESGAFYTNPAFLEVMRRGKKDNRALHLLGIVSFFSSHGSINHLFALMELARREGVRPVYIHAMLGRRGELPESGAEYLQKVEKTAAELGVGELVSVIGRHWSLDREENWDRVERAYGMLVRGEGKLIRP